MTGGEDEFETELEREETMLTRKVELLEAFLEKSKFIIPPSDPAVR